MDLTETLTIIAIVLAPVVAVQVQKWLEIFREDRGRRIWIFKTLMATRAATVAPEHVKALNMIDLEFRGKKNKKVSLAWKTYLDHLSSYPKEDEGAQNLWGERRVELLTRLLIEMGETLGYEFDEVHIKKGIYAPEAHGRKEDEDMLIRRGMLRLLYGDSSLKMDVASFPIGEEEAKEQKALRHAILELAKGERPLHIKETTPQEQGVETEKA